MTRSLDPILEPKLRHSEFLYLWSLVKKSNVSIRSGHMAQRTVSGIAIFTSNAPFRFAILFFELLVQVLAYFDILEHPC